MAEPTQFLESNALLHMQEGETAAAERVLAQLTENELVKLQGACLDLARACGKWIESGGVDLEANNQTGVST